MFKEKKNDTEKNVSNWLIEEGFKLGKLEQLPGIEYKWGYNVFAPPPVQVNIKLFQPKPFPTQIVMVMGVSLSKEHQEALSKLSVNERIEFLSTLLIDLTKICPSCRIAIQPNMLEPKAIVVTRVLFEDNISKPLLIDEITRLINCFLVINASLWRKFPKISGTKKSKEGPLTVM